MTTDRTIDVGGISTHLVCEGEAEGRPAIILLHGWGCNAQTLASIQRVAAATHTVYNFDLPGFGLSAEPPADWGVYEYAQWLRQAIEALGIKHPSLLGHSYGGRIAIVYASEYPAEVDKVILVDAAGIKPRRSLRYYFKVYSFKLGKVMARTFLNKEKAAQWIEKQRSKRGSADYRQSSPTMRSIMSKSVNQDLQCHLPSIKAPTLLIWGENDTATPMRDARIMERKIPDAGLVSFPGCGHYSFLDNPGQFAAVLSSFLRS